MHYNAMFDAESQDGGVIKDELESYIYSCEIDKIKTMRTWTFLQDIIHEQNGSNAKNLAMFKMAGEIMSYFKGSFGQCTVLDGQKPYSTATELFLKNGVGNFFITFDPAGNGWH